jgi:hypothetical protein
LQEAHKKDVQVLAMDFMEEPKHVKEYMAEKGINYPVAIIDESVSTTFGEIEGIPTNFLIDPQGKIIKVMVGYVGKSDIETYMK